MSGYVPKRVASTRTAMGTTDQRPEGTGSVMLGLVSSVGRRRAAWRSIQRNGYTSMLKKECTEGNCPESEYWVSPNTEATNELGFNGLPSGIREVDGSYLKMGLHAFFWTSTSFENTDNNTVANASILHYDASGLSTVAQTLQRGEPCRCVFKYYDSSPPYEE